MRTLRRGFPETVHFVPVMFKIDFRGVGILMCSAFSLEVGARGAPAAVGSLPAAFSLSQVQLSGESLCGASVGLVSALLCLPLSSVRAYPLLHRAHHLRRTQYMPFESRWHIDGDILISSLHARSMN